MENEALSKTLKKYGFKILGFVFFTFFIGWLIQYLYDVWKIYDLYGGIAKGLNGFVQAIEDSTYRTAINTTSADFKPFLLMIYMSASFGFWLIYMLNAVKSKNKTYIVANLILGVLIIAGLTSSIATTATVSNISTKSKNNLLIVKPYLSDKDYSLLESDYYQIDSKNKFQLHYKKIKQIASTHNLTINRINDK